MDVQPFWAEGSSVAGAHRAIYLLPSYGAGSASRQIRLGLGLGFFQFQEGDLEEGMEAGLLAGASGSLRLAGPYSLELGWRLTGDVRGLSTNILMLQLVRAWRF
jgi:hypothetical protein